MTWLDPPTQVCQDWIEGLSCCQHTGTATPGQIASSITWASNELWIATGQRIGPCVSTVRVCPRRCWDSSWDWSMWCASCPPYDVIDLEPGPVTLVSSVARGATTYAKDADWVVLDWRWLAKLEGNWPDEGLVVTYTHGTPPDVSAQRAAEILACEDLKRSTGDKSCRLARERSSRRDGRFEIPEVDAWVSLVNREDDCGIMAPDRMQGFWVVSSG